MLEKIEKKRKEIEKLKEKIAIFQEKINVLEKEVEELQSLEIKGVLKEIDMPFEELIKFMQELKNPIVKPEQPDQKKED